MAECTIQPTIEPVRRFCGVRSFFGVPESDSQRWRNRRSNPCRRSFQKKTWADSDHFKSWAKHYLRKHLVEGWHGVPAEESLLLLWETYTEARPTSSRHTSRKSPTRWCGFSVEGSRMHCSPSITDTHYSTFLAEVRGIDRGTSVNFRG